MKVICLADLHGTHNEIDLPEGDLLIIAGDLCVFGNVIHLATFIVWLATVTPMYKYGAIVIAGNHDTGLDPDMSPQYYMHNQEMLKAIPNVNYLNNSSTTINGFVIYGSPITPTYGNWAFTRDRGLPIKKYWDLIPNHVDILVTHGPPKGILDLNLGCEQLLDAVERVKPSLHIFGHIHPPYGIKTVSETTFINAAQCNIQGNKYVLVNKPIVLEIEHEMAKN
jgi:Icc-related predicted phosphoesterase